MSEYLTNDQMTAFIESLKRDYRVMAPVYEHFGGRFAHTDNLIYQELASWTDFVWQEKSHFSPKEIIFPVTQTLFWFNQDELRESTIDPRPILVFLRACDINALKSLDYLFLNNGDNADVYYQRLRQKLKLVLIECQQSFENCFCVSMNTNRTDNYAAAVQCSPEGTKIQLKDPELAGHLPEGCTEISYEPSFVTKNQAEVRTPDSVCDDPQAIRRILTGSSLWDEYNSRCIACGRCTTSCPTCTCYNVFDVVYNPEEKAGERRRQHTSCMVPGFTDMAGGHGFREEKAERLRFRALHKVNDFKQRQGEHHMCVGCGRCDDRCPQYISFSNIINKMTDAVEQYVSEHSLSEPKQALQDEETAHV